MAAAGLMATAAPLTGRTLLPPFPQSGEALSGSGILNLPTKGQGAKEAPQRLGERAPLLPPFVEVFDDYPASAGAEQFERYFQVINSDGDLNTSGTERSWAYYNFNGVSGDRQFSKCAYLLYPISVAKADDWLIPRAIKLEEGKYYRITMDVSLFQDMGKHILEVKMGEFNDADGMTYDVIPATDVTSITPEQIEGWFVPEFDGLHYMGIHGISNRSEANGNYLFVDNIAMEAARSGREPDKVTDLTFVNDPNGANEVSISFKAPVKGIDGKAITGSVTVTVKRDGEIINTFTTTPGQTLNLTDKVAERSIYTYSFTTGNNDGSGCEYKVNHYVGMKAPEAPVVTAFNEPELGKVHMAWEAPTTDINGVTLNPEKLRYNIYNVTDTSHDLIESNYEGTEIDFNLNLGPEDQEVVMMTVTAVLNNEESAHGTSDFIFVGHPYQLPLYNHFTGLATDPVLGATADPGVTWRMLDDFSDPKAQDGDGSYICMIATQADQYGELSTGKIDLTDVDAPFVSIYTYIYDQDENELTFKVVDCETGEESVAGKYVLADFNTIGWTRIMCPLKQFSGKVVRLVIGANIVSHGYVPLDNMAVDFLYDVDLCIDNVEYTRYATSDETYEVKATVSNIGASDVDGYTVRLLCDGKTVDTYSDIEGLASFTSNEVLLMGNFNAASPEMPTFRVEVLVDNEGSPDDNLSEPFNITFLKPSHPAINDLEAEETESSVTLHWTAPDLTKAAPDETTEDFEKYANFTTEIDGFSMIDADGAFVAGFSGVDLAVTGTKQAFWTMTSAEPYGFLYTLGNSSLFTMASVNSSGRPVANDDWLISPELYGGRQSISFMACSQTIQYGYETFEVYASSTTPEKSEFKKVMFETEVPEMWTQYYVTLPEGTKYFAIRCTSNDCMMLTLDDIRFIPKGDPRSLKLLGYNIYRDGECINDEPVTGTTFVTSRNGAGATFFVTAVYDRGESAASNLVLLGTHSIDGIATDSEQPEEYFDLRGIRVNASSLTPGIYLLRRGTTVTKHIVR